VPLGPQPIGHTQTWDMDGVAYGYPQLTDQAKRKILGENLLRLHGMDLAEAKARAATRS
jgi:hypothetical protein